VIADGQRLAANEAGKRPDLRLARIEGERNDARAQVLQEGHMGEIGGIVHEAAEMDAMPLGEMGEQMPRADLVALVRRIGNAVGEEQDIGHGAPHPRSRAISGPMRLAMKSGNRCQVATMRRYLGLSGLMSGISAPSA